VEGFEEITLGHETYRLQNFSREKWTMGTTWGI